MTAKPHISRKIKLLSQQGSQESASSIATEIPLSLCYNGVAHVVMMVTPVDIENFVLGFSLSEGIIARPSDIEDINISENEHGLIANIWIEKEQHKQLLKRRRNLVGQSGCGLCGVEALEDAVRHYDPVAAPVKYTIEQIHKALTTLEDMQPLHKMTGAVHGAAFMDSNASIKHICEDVGRHNAFDKLIGTLYNSGEDILTGAVILTSRCSFELVQKALSIKLPLLVTISAPTSLAVELAEKHSLTLVTLARHDSMQLINDPYGIFAE